MLNMTKLDGKGQDAKSGAAVLEYLKATEYYIGHDGQSVSSSQWIGRGSAGLGLSGVVDIKVMERLAAGKGPDDEPLRQNAGEVKRVGWDLTFSSGKSFSVPYAAGSFVQKEEFKGTQDRAVQKTVGYLESKGKVRTGKEGLGVKHAITGLVASAHTHFGSRDLDPQIHTHVLTYNVAQSAEDGKWRALDADQMAREVRTAGALYRAQHAWELRQLGYGIVKDRELDADGRETGNIFFKLAGVSDELCERFSKRREAILEYQQEHGGTARQACLATRKHKDEPTYAELISIWGEALNEIRRDEPHLIFSSVDSLKGLPCEFDTFDDAKILQDLHKTESKFTFAKVVERIALENVGQMDMDAILVESEAFLVRNQIVQLDHIQKGRMQANEGEHEYAAQWMLDMEQDIGRRGVERMHDQSVRLDPAVVEASIDKIERKHAEKVPGFKFTDEQKETVAHQTLETGGTAIVSGRAGSGKTTISEVVVDAFLASGKNLVGVSTSWDAAKKLEAESHIQSYSAAKFIHDLENGKMLLSKDDVVIFDEAGMAGTEVIYTIQGFTDAVGAKLILQGDQKQIQPVSAGNPFALLTKHVGDKSITEIRRQRSAEDRKTAEMFYGTPGFQLCAMIMDRLGERGQIHSRENRKLAIEGIADAWMKDPNRDLEKIVMGGTNEEVKLLNEAIRERRKAAGFVGTENATFKAKSGGKWETLKVGTGDRVRFSTLDKKLGVVNGTIGVVHSIKPGRENDSFVLTVKTESDIRQHDKRTVTFDTADFKSLSYAYAGTVHKTQGQGRASVFQLASPSMTDLHSSLVGFTRMKDTFAIYGAEDDLSDMRKRAGQERLKVNAVDQLPQVKRPERLETVSKQLGEALADAQVRKKGKGLSISK